MSTNQSARETFKVNLNRIMGIRGIDQAYIVERLNLTASTVSDWVNGKKYPRVDAMQRLADLLGVSMAELTSDVQRPPIPDAIPYTPMPLVRVVGSVRCGPGGLAIEEDMGYERADVKNPGDYIYLRADGDSMAPQICEGDLALVHLQPDVESGSLAVVVIDGEEGTLKRVIKQAGALVLQSFNPAVEPRIITGAAPRDVVIVGKVVQTVRKW